MRDLVTAAVVYVLALGALFLVLSLTFVGRRTPARADRPPLDIENLGNAMTLFQAKTGQYPEVSSGFTSLIDLGIIDKAPRDAWGNPYSYALVDGRPLITSLGADGLPGGEGINADISNRSAEVSSR